MFEQTFKNIDDILHKDAGCSSEADTIEYKTRNIWYYQLNDDKGLRDPKEILDEINRLDAGSSNILSAFRKLL